MAMEKWKAERRFPLSHRHDGDCEQLNEGICDRCQEEPGQLVHPLSDG
jgi:hypothetical protein